MAFVLIRLLGMMFYSVQCVTLSDSLYPFNDTLYTSLYTSLCVLDTAELTFYNFVHT